MKRSEIKAGDVLYYDERRDWETSGAGSKVIIVDSGKWETIPYYRKDGSLPYRQAAAYTRNARGILAETEAGKRFVASLAALRGPYDEIKAHVDEIVSREQAERERQRRYRDRMREQGQRIVDLAGQLGVTVEVAQYADLENGRVPLDDLEAMLSGLFRAGWLYGKPNEATKQGWQGGASDTWRDQAPGAGGHVEE